MHLGINDTRNLALALWDPRSDKFVDWTASGPGYQLTPFLPSKNLKLYPKSAVQVDPSYTPPAGLFDGLRALNDGDAMRSIDGLMPLLVVVDATGNPVDGQAIKDLSGNPFPVGWAGVFAGWSR